MTAEHVRVCCAVRVRSKSRNVMLSTGSTDGRGIVGKVGDFGLSLKMDVHETHISQVFQGTLSHMAPGEAVAHAAAVPKPQTLVMLISDRRRICVRVDSLV